MGKKEVDFSEGVYKVPVFTSVTREEFIKETAIGKNVVHKVSGWTGEVRVIFPDWGVEVWVPKYGNVRQRWSWGMITRRYPRFIKRFPRPFRFPRALPTLQCHCKIGLMEVEGVSQVKCLRCGFLIGNEAFPRRFELAKKRLKSWIDGQAAHSGDHPKLGKKTGSPRSTSKRVVRKARTKRAAHNRIQTRKKAQAPQAHKRNLVVRSRGRKEKTNGPRKAKGKVSRSKKVQQDAEIPKATGNDQRQESGREQTEATPTLENIK